MDSTLASTADITIPPGFDSAESSSNDSSNDTSSDDDTFFQPLRLTPVTPYTTAKRPLLERNQGRQRPAKSRSLEVASTSVSERVDEKENRIAEHMEKTNEILSFLVKHMKKAETNIEELIEWKQSSESTCSSSSNTPVRRRKRIPVEVPLEVRVSLIYLNCVIM